MMLNVVFLGLTGLKAFKQFLFRLEHEDLQNLPSYLASDLLTKYHDYMPYLIGLAFFTVGLALTDLPHQLSICFGKTKHNCCKSKYKKSEYRDTTEFDLGYHSAFVLVTFQITMIFSILVPIMSLLSLLFFFLKYNVDRYNLSYSYKSTFQGLGIIKKSVVNLSFLNIIVSQIINIGFFAAKMTNHYDQIIMFGIGLVVIETLVFFLVFFVKHVIRI